MRIVLKKEKIGYVFERLVCPILDENAIEEILDAYLKHKKDNDTSTCLMLALMSVEL